jgi:uncharacterized protein (UPF0276 family)
MTALTTTYSEALFSLIQDGHPPIDGIEVGPWYSVADIQRIQDQLEGWPFQFHAGSVITRWRMWPRARRELQRYLAVAHGEWISIHLEMLPWHVYVLSARWGIHLDPPPVDRAIDKFVHTLDRFARAVQLPILIENLPSLPIKKYNYAIEPEVITQVLKRTKAGMVLDIAHARIAASHLGVDAEGYLAALPLDKVQQIHVSGIRRAGGLWQDSHESLRERDYALLQWTLERSQPQVVTLEYFRGQDLLAEQLHRLRDLIGG